MMEVFKKEFQKLLDTDMNYPVLDSKIGGKLQWVPKKTVVAVMKTPIATVSFHPSPFQAFFILHRRQCRVLASGNHHRHSSSSSPTLASTLVTTTLSTQHRVSFSILLFRTPPSSSTTIVSLLLTVSLQPPQHAVRSQ
ncbi:uncharacterized protein G2W53_022523 [Senna tora]|uniref:Uncharacterized protein n=1 Tax=Senna tora TaxID=362788 RepID=A0A834TN38_9FABA|nr:uncharacterized protein G2W53_022523 [Senna tora]